MHYRFRCAVYFCLLMIGFMEGCLPTAPGQLSLNPPSRPLKKGDFDVGISGGATILGGFFVGNLWFRYGLIDPLALDITGFYMNPFVGGANLAVRWTVYDGSLFSLELIPGVGLGSHIGITHGAFHLSPNLGIVGAFKVGPHTIYLGGRSSVSIAPRGEFITTLYNSLAFGVIFTIAKHYHIHLEALGSMLLEVRYGSSTLFAVPTVGFSVDF